VDVPQKMNSNASSVFIFGGSLRENEEVFICVKLVQIMELLDIFNEYFE